MANGNYNMKLGSKETDTPGTFNKKQTDTISKKMKNYIKTSKEYFSDFDQKKDTVVSTRGKNPTILRARHGRKTRGAKTWEPGGTAYSGVKDKMFTDRKTGETIMATKIKKAKNK